MASSVIAKNDFQKQLFNAINFNSFNKRSRLGVAVNHKPESLALIGLLRECFPKESLHAISIDLKLNPAHSNQMMKYAQKMSVLGVPVKSLECDWNTSTSGLKGDMLYKQKISRKIIRHRLNSMLVKECMDNNISTLAFGNTLEDYLTDLLKEIFSLKSGYINGLDFLSSLSVGGDRVTALRPLLKYNMKQILATCQEYQLLPSDNVDEEVEDTINPVRKMILDACDTESQQIGDTFLTIPKLLDLGFQMFEHRMEVWKRDISKHDQGFHWMNDTEITHAIFTILLSMINGCDPLTSKYSPEILENFRATLMKTKKIPMSIAKGLLNPPRASDTGRGIWIFGRQPFTKSEFKDLKYSLKSGETVLWDNRFKVTVSCDSPEKSFVIRPFTIQDFTSFEDNLRTLHLPIDMAYSYKEKLKLFKTRTPLLLRQGLPCIEMNGKLISIPSLDINIDTNVRVDFKYCGYKSAFGKVVGLGFEHFESPETQSDEHVHVEE